MSSTNPIRIETSVNIGPLQAGMDDAAVIVKGSTEEMSASFQKAGEASSAAIAEMRAQIEALQLQLTELNAKIDEVPVHAVKGFGEARGAARLLGEELGIHMNRELGKVLSQSSLLGPALSAAFGVIAVAGFVAVAAQIAEKMSQWISDAFIFTKAMKDAYAANLAYSAANNKLVEDQQKAGEEELRLSREIALIGKTPLEAARMRAEWSKEALGHTQEQATAAAALAAQDQAQLEILIQKRGVEQAKPQIETIGIGEGASADITDAAKNVEALTKQIDDLNLKMDADRRAAADAATGVKGLGVANLETAKAMAEAAHAWEETPFGKAGFNESGAKSYQATLDALGRTFQNTFTADGPLQGLHMATEGITAADEAMMAAKPVLTETWTEMADKAKAAYEKISGVAEQTMRGQIEAAKQLEQANVAAAEKEVQQKLITADQLARIKLDELAKEEQAELAALNARLNSLGPQELAKRTELNAQLLNLNAQYLRTKEQQDQLADQQMLAHVQAALNQMTSAFNSAFQQWLSGHKSFEKSMEQAWGQMVQKFIMYIVQMGEKWIMQHVLMAAADKAMQALGLTSLLAANAAKVASNKVVATSAAGLAGASMVATVAAAPYPVDLTAPAEGAVAAASAAGFATALGGGVMAEDAMVGLHANEMILPPSLSQFVQTSAAKASSGGGGGGGDTHLHVHATDGDSVAKLFRSQGGMIRRTIRQGARGGIPPRKAGGR